MEPFAALQLADNPELEPRDRSARAHPESGERRVSDRAVGF
jgi:hypothetical protein